MDTLMITTKTLKEVLLSKSYGWTYAMIEDLLKQVRKHQREKDVDV